MTWYFYDDTTKTKDQIMRGHEISAPENVALVNAASAAMAELGIGPVEGERFQTMLKVGEVSFAGVNDNDHPILATQKKDSHPELQLIGEI